MHEHGIRILIKRDQWHLMDAAAPDRFHQPLNATEGAETTPTTSVALIVEDAIGAEAQPLPLHECAGEGLSRNDALAVISRNDPAGQIRGRDTDDGGEFLDVVLASDRDPLESEAEIGTERTGMPIAACGGKAGAVARYGFVGVEGGDFKQSAHWGRTPYLVAFLPLIFNLFSSQARSSSRSKAVVGSRSCQLSALKTFLLGLHPENDA